MLHEKKSELRSLEWRFASRVAIGRSCDHKLCIYRRLLWIPQLSTWFVARLSVDGCVCLRTPAQHACVLTVCTPPTNKDQQHAA